MIKSYDVQKPRCRICGAEAINWVVWEGSTIIGCECVRQAGYQMVMFNDADLSPPLLLRHVPRNGVVLIK